MHIFAHKVVRFLHILKIEPIKFAGELDMGYAEKRGLKILVGLTEKRDLSPFSIVYILFFFFGLLLPVA